MRFDLLAIIMAGGFGTRFRSLTCEMAERYPELFLGLDGCPAADIPKPLALIDGVPVLEREIMILREQGFTDIILTVSYLHEVIESYFGDGAGISRATGEPFGVSIRYFVEEQPLGNAGSLYKLFALGELKGDFLLLNADSLFDIDFKRIVDFHHRHKAQATLFTHPNSHPYDSGLIITSEDGSGRVEHWMTKEDRRPAFYHNRVNAGLHVLSCTALDEAVRISGIQPDKIGRINEATGEVFKVDLDRQILKPLCQLGHVFAYDSPEYVKDMGTPERFASVVRDFQKGTVEAKNLKCHQKAIFLDRDGTINRYCGFLRNLDEFELLPGVAESICKFNAAGFLVIVVTNQPVLARGEVSFTGLEDIHKKMETLLGEQGAYVDGVYVCPHHPDKGFVGEIPELKIECNCRKPKPGLILRAAEDFNIDLTASWMVGDSVRDIKCGISAGCNTALLIGEGTAPDASRKGSEAQFAEVVCNDMKEFCDFLLKE